MSNSVQKAPTGRKSALTLQEALQYATDLYEQAQLAPTSKVFNQAIEVAKKAKQASRRSSEPYRYSVELLVMIFNQRHKAYGERSDLDNAIQNAEEGASFNHIPSRIASLQNLAILQTDLFVETREVDHAKSAFSTACDAVELARQHEVNDQASCEATLASVLLRLSQETTEIFGANQLDYAIERVRWALAICGEHPDATGWRHNLALMLELKCERTGDAEYLNSAINDEESVLAATALSDMKRPLRLCALGNMLSRKFLCTGDTAHLDDALDRLHEAVRLSIDRPELGETKCLNSLALTLSDKFERGGELKDLQEAVERLKAASEKERNPTEKAIYLGSLATCLRLFYEQTEERSTLSEALAAGKSALKLTTMSANHPFHLSCANNLAIIYTRQFELLRDTESFKEANRLFSEANNTRPLDDPDWAVSSINLANLHYYESEHRDLEKALDFFLRACRCTTTRTTLRVKAAQMAIGIMEDEGLFAEAIEVGDSALKMLPELCDRSLSLSDQQHAVLQIAGLAAEVCSLYLQENRVSEALQKVEFGRGLILRYMFDKQDSVAALEQDCPDLAREYKRLLFQISTVDSSNASTRLMLARQRIGAGERLKEVVCQIRQRKGYEAFLLEPSLDELKSCATGGVIIVVNATLVRADAIIVSSECIRSIELPEMKESLDKWSSDQEIRASRSASTATSGQGRDAGSGTRSANNRLFLEWLWYTCVKPILQEINGSYSHSQTGVPHVWWLGTGLATRFPFHAAGCYKGDPRENCLQQTISSYTSSIRALAYAHSLSQRRGCDAENEMSILVVTMPTTPGQAPLDGVRDEWFAIRNACDGVFRSELLENPTAEHVLGRLGGSEIVHFACHGLSDPHDPSHSHLLLQKESQSGVILDKLTVSSICSTISKGGRTCVAYLSACSTAEVRATRFTDESLHIASAFQVAGFPNVIGSLWPTKDDVCVKVTDYFYKSLATKSPAGGKKLSVASAYRDAVLRVRAELFAGGLEGDPMSWAAYVHLGA
ncbi:hypothetical protein Asppvi_005308 [Aspergillus pseudoviridinutans]|uniref:CHAT domain-containing protein n=1 Tax=Aspergillus pseudoviridinutans TaxID=1517512 RepID=A0A9P3B943_9EURO|nr:uncharacterized protein Asppvi_005308 [Aspergillus pseudoviridinutans]GIJ86420.1 hypothetical protein Asppvi_005308 [Aspergillus pseudoviridinutans]